jgi:hypothetical protein
MNLPALLDLGLVVAAYSILRGHRAVLTARDTTGRARRIVMSQRTFAARFSH